MRVEFPDDSVAFIEMTGSGTVWEGFFTASGFSWNQQVLLVVVR